MAGLFYCPRSAVQRSAIPTQANARAVSTTPPAGVPTFEEMQGASRQEVTATHVAALGTVYELARGELARRPRSAPQLVTALGRVREVWALLRWEQRVASLAAGAITSESGGA